MKREITEKNIPQIIKGKPDQWQMDTKIRGFGARVRNGVVSFSYQYKVADKSYRLTIGTHPATSCAEARRAALEHQGQKERAKDGRGSYPHEARSERQEKANQAPETLGGLLTKYFDNPKLKQRRASTVTAIKLHLEKHFARLHALPIAGVTLEYVDTTLERIAEERGDVAANRARASLSTFFAWAVKKGYCQQNPVINSDQRGENEPRSRTLSDEEIVKLWLSAPDDFYGTIVKLLLLTGCRRDEIGGLQWDEIDLEKRTITIPGSRTKNGKAHTVPLSDTALSIIQSIPRTTFSHVFGRRRDTRFGGWSKYKDAFDATLKLEKEWCLHDLRRTFRTGLAACGVAPFVAEACLNHLPPKIEQTYGRYDYAKEKREALDKWAHHLKTEIAKATGANVTRLLKK